MKILRSVRKVPGGMMVVPLLMGVATNTFFPQFFEIGGFTQALFQNGAGAILGVFLFANGAQISVKQAGPSLVKGTALLISKLLVGALIGITVSKVFGPYGILGITPLAFIAALTNSNGGLFAALAAEYGDATDVGAISIVSINDGPFLTMIVLGASGLASIPFTALLATVFPIIVGFILGNLDNEIAEFLEPATAILIPFFAFPLGAALSFNQLFDAGISGVILGLTVVAFTGLAGYLTFKLLKTDNPEVGAAIGTTAGNAVGTPAAVALADPSMAAVAAVATVATGQIAAAIMVTAILTPLLVEYLANRERSKVEEKIAETT